MKNNLNENTDNLLDYRKKLASLSDEEKRKRDLQLKQFGDGRLQGPLFDKDTMNKQWLVNYSDEAILTELPKMKIYDYLYECNKDNTNGIAINFFGLKTTYKQLFEKIDRVAKSLLELGVKPGDIVVVNSVTLPQTVYLMYALNKIGAVADFTDLRTDKDGMKHYIDEGKTKILFTFDSAYNEFSSIIENTSVEKVIFLNAMDEVPELGKILTNFQEKKAMTPAEKEVRNNTTKIIKNTLKKNNNVITWNDFLKLGRNHKDIVSTPYQKDAPAAIVHTSGTSNVPKSVVLTNDNFNSMAKFYQLANVDYNRSQSFLNIIPIFVAYGAVNALHMPLCLGMTNIVYPKVVGRDFPDILQKFKPDHVLAIPMHWNYLKAYVDDFKYEIKRLTNEYNLIANETFRDNSSLQKMGELKKKINKLQDKLNHFSLSFLKTAGCGGDKLDPIKEKELNEFLKEFGSTSEIIKGYGMTEVASCASTNLNGKNEIGSIGIPHVGNNIGIFDPETGKEVSNGEQGEICIQSLTQMKEYLNNPEETQKIIRQHDDGSYWLHTGDIGHFNDNNFLYFDERMKRQIINRGFKVSASAIEDLIRENKFVNSCCVVGVKHEENGEIPVAVIVIKKEYEKEKDVILEVIKEKCQKNLPEYCMPELFVCIDQLPYTKNSKIDYKKVEQIATEKFYTNSYSK